MTPERRREIATLGGKSLKPEQRTFYTNRQLASDAGRKGGSQPKKRLATLASNSVGSQTLNVPRGADPCQIENPESLSIPTSPVS